MTFLYHLCVYKLWLYKVRHGGTKCCHCTWRWVMSMFTWVQEMRLQGNYLGHGDLVLKNLTLASKIATRHLAVYFLCVRSLGTILICVFEMISLTWLFRWLWSTFELFTLVLLKFLKFGYTKWGTLEQIIVMDKRAPRVNLTCIQRNRSLRS